MGWVVNQVKDSCYGLGPHQQLTFDNCDIDGKRHVAISFKADEDFDTKS